MKGCYQPYPGFPTALTSVSRLVALKHRLICLLKQRICVWNRLLSVYHLVVSMSICVEFLLERHPDQVFQNESLAGKRGRAARQ